MSTQTTSNLTNTIGTRYIRNYMDSIMMRRIYDQLAVPVGASQFDLETRRGLGTTYTFPHLSKMTPSQTAVSESADLVPQILIDALTTITPTSRMDGLKWSELLDLEVWSDYVAKRAAIVGENCMDSLEVLAYTAALAGTLKVPGTARASLDAGTAADTWTEAALWKAAAMIQELRCPPLVSPNGMKNNIAIAHSDAYYDLFHGGNVLSAITYGGLPGEKLLNGELGMVGGFRLVISPFAKVFGGAGADNGTGSSQTYVLSAAADALATSLSVTTGTNVVYGRYLTVGTEETSTTFYPTNERVRWVSGTTTASIIGGATNGGLMYSHAATDYVLNADSVYPVVYGGKGSLVKAYATEVGEFGEMVGPKSDGMLNQWQSLGWKFYGGYGRVAENYILRGEYSSSLDA